MKLGVVSRIGEFPQEHWEREFEVFGKKEQGATHLEIISNYPYLGPLDYTEEQGELLTRYAKKNKLKLTMHLLPNQRGLSKKMSQELFSSEKATQEFVEHEKQLFGMFNIGSLDERVRKQSAEEVKLALKMARDIGMELITIHGGAFIDEKDYEQHLEASRKTLEELNPYFKNAEVKLCVENLPSTGHVGNQIKEYPKSSKGLLYLVSNLKNVGVCLDVGHANVSGGVLDFYDSVMATGKLWDMHLHDNLGDKDNHLKIYSGNVPFEELFKRLKRDNYSGYLSIELDTWCRKEMHKDERIFGLYNLRRLIK